ncbi:hypothetical protein ml_194 [Mollivirus sibericum]|uniref:hypothetical protein n=1 Tax=Mollivirus sibericum TaxID=1678078 RepID=UPI0006B2ECDE|nr:hypothetical protein ml_194 [Mollivirus sibericum]ALD61996.1 hypothetical protein ml_194 [Mollivirus sibericum]
MLCHKRHRRGSPNPLAYGVVPNLQTQSSVLLFRPSPPSQSPLPTIHQDRWRSVYGFVAERPRVEERESINSRGTGRSQ